MNIQEKGFLRLHQIIGSKKANIPPIIPVSATSWWNGVKSGKYPKAIKLGPKTTVWRASEVLSIVQNGG